MPVLDVFVDEVGKKFQVAIVKADGTTPRDISGGTITLEVERNQTVTMAITNGPGGLAEYDTLAGDYPTPGVFSASVKAAGLAGGITTRTEVFQFTANGIPEAAP